MRAKNLNQQKKRKLRQHRSAQGIIIDEVYDGIQEFILAFGKKPVAILLPRIKYDLLVAEANRYNCKKVEWYKTILGVPVHRKNINHIHYCKDERDIDRFDKDLQEEKIRIDQLHL